MPSTPERKGNKPSKQLAAIDRLLIAGIKQGPAKKRDAINRVLELVPGWTREDCWERIRHLRKTPEFVGSAEDHPNKPKTGPVRRHPCAAVFPTTRPDRPLGTPPLPNRRPRQDGSPQAKLSRLHSWECHQYSSLVGSCCGRIIPPPKR